MSMVIVNQRHVQDSLLIIQEENVTQQGSQLQSLPTFDQNVSSLKENVTQQGPQLQSLPTFDQNVSSLKENVTHQ